MVRSVMLHWPTVYGELFLPLVGLNFLAALSWGGTKEVWVAAGYLAATILQKFLEGWEGSMFSQFEPFVAFVDIALAIGLALLAVRNPKVWIVCAASLQLVVSLAHFAKLLDPHLSPLAYAILMGSGGYPSQILLSIGIGLHARRARPARHLLSSRTSKPRLRSEF